MGRNSVGWMLASLAFGCGHARVSDAGSAIAAGGSSGGPAASAGMMAASERPDAAPASSASDAATAPLRPADSGMPRDGAATLAPDAGSACGGAAFCDSFEQGGELDTALYEIVQLNCSGDGHAAIDSSVAHAGTKSLKVQASAGYCNHVFVRLKVSSLPDPLYLRFFVRFESALGSGHVSFAAFHDQSEDKDLRFGGQSQVLIWNRESDDATLPELSPAGIALSVSPAPAAWRCVELMVGANSHELRTFVDGAAVAGLTADPTPTPDVDTQWLRKTGWQPKLIDARIGFESYASDSNTLWFDDVALGSARIGCGG